MDFRSFGRTGMKVSPLCLGCMMFGAKADEAASIHIVEHAIDAGINLIDTANVYSRGVSETILGKALRQSGKRDRLVVATKVHGRMDDDDPNAQGNSRRHIIQQCEASLKRLQCEWIDLYQIHRPRPDVAIDETLRALDDLIRAGKVRYIGTSTFAAWQVVEALWAARELRLNRFVSEQPPYHLLDRRIERELVPMAQTYGLALMPWAPLAGGFLTGKYDRASGGPADSRFGGQEDSGEHGHFCDAGFAVVETLKTIAEEKRCTPSQLALGWCLGQPGITSPIIGPRTIEQLKDNLGAIDVRITDDDRRRIDEVAPRGSMIAPYYVSNFGPHPHWVI